MYSLCEAALQSGIGVDEVMHLLGVSSHYAHELSAVVFQTLQKRVDSLRPERILVSRP